ncbi:MAG: class I SAM-dependent methyltransferase [Stellaceae bacterium]
MANPGDRKAQTRAQFNALAADYDAGPGCFAHFGRRLVSAAGVSAGQHVLDVATGRGAVLFPAAEATGRAGRIAGVDLADEMARATNADAAQRNLKAQVNVGDAENLEFPAGTFDRVLCGFGLMFFPDQDKALREFRRVLKENGKLGLSTWHIDQAGEVKAAAIELGLTIPEPPGWITEPDDLSLVVTRAGFSNVRVEIDSHAFRYADLDEYWRQARGTGFRRILDSLDETTTRRLYAALSERVRSHQKADGLYLKAAALMAVAER